MEKLTDLTIEASNIIHSIIIKKTQEGGGDWYFVRLLTDFLFPGIWFDFVTHNLTALFPFLLYLFIFLSFLSLLLLLSRFYRPIVASIIAAMGWPIQDDMWEMWESMGICE